MLEFTLAAERPTRQTLRRASGHSEAFCGIADGSGRYGPLRPILIKGKKEADILKRLLISLTLILIFALPAFAVFSPKGQIPNGHPVEYRGLKVTSDGVNIIIVNRGETTVKFSAACSFIDENRKEIGDIFIEEISLPPKEEKRFTGLHFKGDLKLARKAASLRWTIYTLEN